jgi:signal transduction histidine kinase
MSRSRLSVLRGFLFGGGVLLIIAILIATSLLARRVEREAHATSVIFAEFAANTVTNISEQNEATRDVYRDVIARITFPIILTDREGRPQVWRNIGVKMDEVTDFERTSYPDSIPTAGPLATVLAKVVELDAQNEPIRIRPQRGSEEFGRVHFGRSPLVDQIRWFPLLEFSILLVFLLLALMGYRSIKESEQRSVWVGMAKETAHQLGTPISSLMGWHEVLRERLEDSVSPPGSEDKAILDRAFIDDVANEMENDTARLEKIASRFSNVGSVPNLHEQDIVPVVAEAARYLSRRLPQVGTRVEIVEHFEEVPAVNVNRELLEWVVENLLRNALDSFGKDRGTIHVEVRRHPRTESVDIRIADTGRGMSPAEAKRVFEPGYTTKPRGWGLGLSLSRRIIHEYHGGRIFVERTAPGEGSTFVIRFPT